MTTTRRGSFPALIVVGLAATLAPWAATPAEARRPSSCVTAQIHASFRLPDGAVHPAGELTLCESRALTRTSRLHVVLVGGRRVGTFLSHDGVEPETGLGPEIVFAKDAGGTLSLVGYTLPVRGSHRSYRMREPLRPADLAGAVALAAAR
jgi:hypothetical protein